VYHFSSSARGEQEIATVHLQEDVLVEDSLGSRTWGSASLLASSIIQRYLPMHLNASRESHGKATNRERDLRILELGSGTGLVGLAIADYMRRSGQAGQIYLTDFHLQVLKNLKVNAEMNGWLESDKPNTVDLHVLAVDWRDSSDLQGDFDLIVAAGE
jgi:methylase of polypeptide subunit release factors